MMKVSMLEREVDVIANIVSDFFGHLNHSQWFRFDQQSYFVIQSCSRYVLRGDQIRFHKQLCFVTQVSLGFDSF